MIRVALKGLWARKRRLAGAFTAVFLGVSFLVGTLVLGDTMDRSIGRFFGQAYAGTDASVRSSTNVSDEPMGERGTIDAALADRVRQVPGVAVAEPVISGSGQLLGRDGRAIAVLGPRTAGNWLTDARLNPYHVVEGRAPRAAGEVVVNKAVADKGRLRVGDATAVLTPQRVPVRVVGIARFGDQDGFGGTSFTAFTTADAQRYVARSADRISSVSVRAATGVSQETLVRRLRPVLPAGTEAVTGKALGDEGRNAVATGFLNVFRAFLLVFSGIALLVGTLGIHNTFTVTVAQRSRESALLRAIGASRRQVLGSVLVEAAGLGLVASAAGVGGGLGCTLLIESAFTAMGASLPTGGPVLTATTVAVAVPVGVLVTLVSCLFPALRASRTPPVAALRETAAEPPGISRARTITGAVLTALGAVLLVASSGSMAVAGSGAVACVVGMVALGPAAARPAGAVLGAPLRQVTGQLARRNTTRDPRRVAGAATALMVGIGVVTLFTVIAASSKASIQHGAARSFGGDLAISTGSAIGGGFGPGLAGDVARLPQVAAAAGMGTGSVRVDGTATQVRYADPAALGRILDLGSGGRAGAGQLAVSADTARSHGWRVGSPVAVVFADGARRTLTVGGTYDSGGPAGDYLLPRAEWLAHDPQPEDTTLLIKLRPGTSTAEGERAVTAAARPYAAPDVQSRQDYIESQASGVGALLTLVYVMLALAIVIALLGIANTLSLSVHERTRELGLLRAVGATRGQIRSMVRWESLIVALFGTAGGVALGLLPGWALARAATDGTFAVPVVPLVVIVLIGALAGVLAALRPAHRAGQLDVLRAVAVG